MHYRYVDVSGFVTIGPSTQKLNVKAEIGLEAKWFLKYNTFFFQNQRILLKLVCCSCEETCDILALFLVDS